MDGSMEIDEPTTVASHAEILDDEITMHENQDPKLAVNGQELPESESQLPSNEYDSEEEDIFPTVEAIKRDKTSEEDAADPVVKKFDIYLSHALSPNLFLFQYPLRPISRPYDFNALKKCLYKKDHAKFTLTFERSTNTEHFDVEHYKPTEANTFSLSSTKVPLRAAYAIGVLRSNEFHLTPLENIMQLRPDTSYMNSEDFLFQKGGEKIKKKAKKSKKKKAADSDDEDDDDNEDAMDEDEDGEKGKKGSKAAKKKKAAPKKKPASGETPESSEPAKKEEEGEEDEENDDDEEGNTAAPTAAPIINKKEMEQMKATYYYFKQQEQNEKPVQIELVTKNDESEDMQVTTVFDKLFYQKYNVVSSHLPKATYLDQWLKYDGDFLSKKTRRVVSLDTIRELKSSDQQISVSMQLARCLNYIRIFKLSDKAKSHEERLACLERISWYLGNGIFVIKSDFLKTLSPVQKTARDILLQCFMEKKVAFLEGFKPKNLELYLKSPIKRTTRLALTNFFHSQNSASNLFTIFEVFPKQSKNEVNQFIVNELLQTIANYDKKSQTWILKPKPLSKFEAKFPDFCLQQEKNWKVLVQQNENALKTRFKVLGYSVVTNVLSTNSETFKPNAQTSEVSADAPTNMQTAQQIEQKNMINALKLFLVQAFNKLGVCSYDLLWNAFKAHQAKNQNVSGLKNIKEALFKQALGLMGQTFGGKNDVYVLKGRKKEEEEFRKPILELFSTFPEKEFTREEIFAEVAKSTKNDMNRSMYLKLAGEFAIPCGTDASKWKAKTGSSSGQ